MRSGKNSGKFIKIKSLDITEMSNIKAFNFVRYIIGAGRGNRTLTVKPHDFESCASASSAMPT